jgi:hypothetical protein
MLRNDAVVSRLEATNWGLTAGAISLITCSATEFYSTVQVFRAPSLRFAAIAISNFSFLGYVMYGDIGVFLL